MGSQKHAHKHVHVRTCIGADNTWKILFYDNAKRPVFIEPITSSSSSSSSSSKKNSLALALTAPCNLALSEGGGTGGAGGSNDASIVDHLGREWGIKFQTRQEGFRMLAFVLVARVRVCRVCISNESRSRGGCMCGGVRVCVCVVACLEGRGGNGRGEERVLMSRGKC